MIEVFIRPPQPEELRSVRALVQTVVDEVYGGVWALTNDEWLDDLWVLREARGYGFGRRLLAQAEAEMVARGHETLRLRVVQSNAAAIRSYRRHGWEIAGAFPHEKISDSN